jgi:hypothetical protein
MFTWLKDWKRRRAEEEWNRRLWSRTPLDATAISAATPTDGEPSRDPVERPVLGLPLHFLEGGASGGGGATGDWDSSSSSDSASDCSGSDSGSGGDCGGGDGGGSSD